MQERDDIDPDRIRARLEARRADLAVLMAGEGEETRQTVELDQTRQGRLSRMDALQMQAMNKESDRRRQVEMQRVEAALERLEAGRYGICTACEEDIAMARLEADPATALCIDCAQGAESAEGAGGR